ncbi:MAG TPA: YjbQ family protein [Chthoniobacterales bacterium]|nr:YjbQ family protein [Chthoniobacterales bacterium]
MSGSPISTKPGTNLIEPHLFAHRCQVSVREGTNDIPSHIRMLLTRTSETVPIVSGKMQLGTWQGIFLFEHRRSPHRRRVRLAIIGE